MELIFVYNAKSDAVSVLVDYAHKFFSPKTYACDLCSLTHSNLGERKAWKTFTEQTDATLEFYHIEDFEQTFNTSYEYPVVLEKSTEGLTILLSKADIAKLPNVEALVETLSKIISSS